MSWYTPISQIAKKVNAARLQAVNCKELNVRRFHLKQLLTMLTDHAKELQQAVFEDLKKPPIECEIAELNLIRNDIVEHLNCLDEWTAPEYPSVSVVNKMDGICIQPQPLGTVLIIGAWNYPIQLTCLPLVGVLSAGNSAVIKPSECSPKTAQLLSQLFDKYLPGVVAVINGAVDETTELLKQRFDKILYTGGARVAKVISRAAAEYLTPMCLELGGKSPVFVDTDMDKSFLTVTARRIAWGRFSNAGQTCVAPDYIMTHRSMFKPLNDAIATALREFYGEDPQKSENYGRIVNEARFSCLSGLIKSSKNQITIGGNCDAKDLYISPTVLSDVKSTDAVMQDEIFGPILPMMHVNSVDEAIEFVNNGEKPLALYVFSNKSSISHRFLNNTTSGGAIVNDTLMHASIPELPFGGVGFSGMGAYHGKFSFDLFTHKRSVMIKNLGLESLNVIRYPPYSETKFSIVKFLTGKTQIGVFGKFLKYGFPILKLTLLAVLIFFVFRPSAFSNLISTYFGK